MPLVRGRSWAFVTGASLLGALLFMAALHRPLSQPFASPVVSSLLCGILAPVADPVLADSCLPCLFFMAAAGLLPLLVYGSPTPAAAASFQLGRERGGCPSTRRGFADASSRLWREHGSCSAARRESAAHRPCLGETAAAARHYGMNRRRIVLALENDAASGSKKRASAARRPGLGEKGVRKILAWEKRRERPSDLPAETLRGALAAN